MDVYCIDTSMMSTLLESLDASLPNLPSLPPLPPFFFHYVICILCVVYLISIAVLKFKYYFWYHQPLTFRFSVKRWYAARQPGTFTSTMNASPSPTNVNYENVKVYSTVSVDRISRSSPPDDIPFIEIAKLLNKEHKFTVGDLIPYIHHERLACILSNETHGLAAFVGVFRRYATSQASPGHVHGVCILTPRIKIERDRTSSGSGSGGVSSGAAALHPLSTSIYVCDHLAWSKYDVNERESLELLETTEYIQKSREIAGEQTLYRYNQIPWFVIPFTTVYTYALSLERLLGNGGIGGGIGGRGQRGRATTIIKVTSVNFAIFYAFINECSRDFSCSILNEITHLQHLIQSGIYQIYMLLLNNTRVLSVYIYGPSWARIDPLSSSSAAAAAASGAASDAFYKKKTRGNRINRLHNYISQTSTAVVKYLPPVIPVKYDLSGKRVVSGKRTGTGTGTGGTYADILYNPSAEIPRLLSSIRNKQVCEIQDFVNGFIDSLKMRSRETGLVLIDTIAHNYIIIDEIIRSVNNTTTVPVLLWSHKWYYVLYNAIIHREIQCKDLFMV